jgi:hypothetical protein
MALSAAHPSLYALLITGATRYRSRQVKVLPQIRKLLELLLARRTQHGASGRIGEDDASLRIGNQHAFGEIV